MSPSCVPSLFRSFLVPLFVVAAILSGIPPASSQTSSTKVFNTGVDARGNLLTNGAVDPHYTFNGGSAVVVTNGVFPLDGNWLPDGPNSLWIGPSSNGFGPQFTDTHYQVSVDLTGYDLSTVSIGGSWSMDNVGTDILINGASGFASGNVVNPTARDGFHAFHPFTIFGGFIPGVNTIDFIVHNDDGPTGFRVDGLTLNGTISPPPPPPPPSACIVNVDRLGQCDGKDPQGLHDTALAHYPHWGAEILAYTTNTMCSAGCATTTFSMALRELGVNTLPPSSIPNNDPGTLNDFVKRNQPLPNPDNNAARMVVAGILGFQLNKAPNGLSIVTSPNEDHVVVGPKDLADPVNGPLFQFIDDALCAGHPVFVSVPSPCTLRASGCKQPHPYPQRAHSVLVVGQDGNDYLIKDPAGLDPNCASKQACATAFRDHLVAGYGRFQVKGYIVDPGGDRSLLAMFAGENVELLLTDGAGRRTGFDSATATTLIEIPLSIHSAQGVDDDLGLQAPPITHAISVSQPLHETFRLTVTGLSLGLYSLDVWSIARDGSPKPATFIHAIAGTDSMGSFDITFDPTPGATTRVTRLANSSSTLDDIENALRLGLIDDGGIANSLSQKINAAADATSRGQNNAAKNILNAFLKELSAQTGKHVMGIAPQVLSEDAQSLLSQVP